MNTILFDMDGVIVDSEPINLKIIAKIYDEIGVEVPDEVHLSSLGVNSIEWWTHILNTYGNNGYTPEELYDRERTRILNYMTDPNTDKGYFDHLKETLEVLKQNDFKLGVASSSHYDIINSILKLGDLEQYFDVIVSGTDPAIKKGKPEPDIFLYTADQLDSAPNDCIVIEDSEKGLEAAKKAGMISAAFLSAPKPIDTSNADFIFDDYKDFFKNIELLNHLEQGEEND